ncbi:MAG TPA: phosphoribosylglycinamide formyltransferase [Gammaproteobacteria bacterium]|jgi:phosphoribosylglycinamide formyltransferase-1|nr:phosphoribosylglycinamide formyltransferase [Gammaproteobacteria bacterium]HIF87718.1 phosphoribosylglycinamide formyltransferase [Gammaproteobacteria bacterium]HIL64514.1 phosphoribosylglycinamide formyltransferase [Porticoccaceae bacterium]|tara:strand:+ start:39926 stop:40603 length:678 start_codon:yes stop_codon:yes gene_type:complete
MEKTHCHIVVLISGNGTNLQALINASTTSNFRVVAVVSNNHEAFGLQRATVADIPALVVDHDNYSSRQDFDRKLIEVIDAFDPELIVLAGFMRILGPEFVQHYQGRILNIHPSLLPAYTGVNTHQRVLDAGDKEHGVSVHFVTDELDGGPVVAQEKIAVLTTDTAAQLATRVAAKEHIIYPKVVSWFAAGRLHMDADGAYMDHDKLPAGGVEIHPAAVQDSIRLP